MLSRIAMRVSKRLSEASSAAMSTDAEQSIIAPKTKRPRYVPTPLDAEAETSSASTTTSPGRYSLRIRTTSTASSSETTVKTEATIKTEEESPRKKAIVKKEQDPFAKSPRKTSIKPIKLDLDPSEARAAPKRWQEQYAVLMKQRKRIIAPVDTLGCEENGKDEKRQDKRLEESQEEQDKRERFTLLVSLMLSSQTKDPVTAAAVHNLQRELPGGLNLQSILTSPQELISSCINKVGFWRRKTGYLQSAAQILKDDFDGDLPKTIDEICSLPGVGPKMGFLALQGAWGLNLGIGVDVHVHRVSNRLKWVKSVDPEGTRLQLQSWLPKELHRTINKTLVGFGQVICQPVGPRCDLCQLGKEKLCPSFRKVDPKSIASRVKIELLPDEDDENVEPKIAVKVEGEEGEGVMVVKEEEDKEIVTPEIENAIANVKSEKGLEW